MYVGYLNLKQYFFFSPYEICTASARFLDSENGNSAIFLYGMQPLAGAVLFPAVTNKKWVFCK